MNYFDLKKNSKTSCLTDDQLAAIFGAKKIENMSEITEGFQYIISGGGFNYFCEDMAAVARKRRCYNSIDKVFKIVQLSPHAANSGLKTNVLIRGEYEAKINR